MSPSAAISAAASPPFLAAKKGAAVFHPSRNWVIGLYYAGWLIAFTGFGWQAELGTALMASALLLAVALLPAEYAAAAIVFGPLAASLYKSLPGFYMNNVRWAVILAGAAFLWFRTQKALRRSPARKPSIFVPLIFLYLAVAFSSVLVSVSPSLTFSKSVAMLAAMGAAWMASHWLLAEYGSFSALHLARAWLVFLLPVLAANVASFFLGVGQPYLGGAFTGYSGNPNSLGAVVAFFFPFLAAYFVDPRVKLTPRMQALGVLMFCCGFMLIACRSRAAALAAFIGMMLMAAVHRRGRLPKLAVLCGTGAVLALLASPARLTSAAEEWIYKGREEGSVLDSRVQEWRLSQELFAQHPLLGAGFGVTSELEARWELGDFDAEQLRYLRVERGSSFWAALSQVGLLGGIPLFLAVAAVLIRSLSFAAAVRDPWLTAAAASVWAAAAQSFFEGWIVSPGNGLLWVFLVHCFFLDAVTRSFRPPRRNFALPSAPPVGR